MKATVLSLLPVVAMAAQATEITPVPYPEGYRSWYHVKSMVIESGHPLYESFGGIHHLYANANALEGYRTGNFKDGAVIVFDLLEAHRGDNAITEGARKVAGVMHRDATQYAATGGWGFEGFAGGKPNERVVGNKAAQSCYNCHAQQANTHYLFSRLRD